MILIILFTLILALIISWYIKYYKYEKFLKNVPGPTPLPLIGNALHFSTNSSSEMMEIGMKLREKYGSIFKLTMGFENPILSLSNAKAIEFVSSSTELIKKGQNYRFLHNWLGTGLLTSDGQKWAKHRKMLTPAFHFKILEQFIPIFNSFSKILIEKLRKEVGKDSVDIYPYITLFTLDVICATSMGTNVRAQMSSNSTYVENVKEMCRIAIGKMLSPIRSLHFIYMFTKDYAKEKSALNILHNYTNSVITARKAELDKKTENVVQVDEMGIKKKLTFLDLMLQHKMEKNDITDDEIRQEVDTFTFEGHDTTSSGISFTLYCLSVNLDVQKKVIEELESIYSDDWTRNCTYNDLQDMKYLEMVIKESLRLYSPVPFFEREVQNDTKFDDLTIPKGTTLFISVFAMHRCSITYPDPERFDPERFTLDEQNKRSPFAYIPFSAGPRNCIGQKFAMMELKFVISTILRNFELLPTIPEHVPIILGDLLLKSKNGLRMRLKKRTRLN